MKWLLVGVVGWSLAGCAQDRQVVIQDPVTPQPPVEEQTAETGELQWAANFDAATEQARTDNKLVMLKFTADW